MANEIIKIYAKDCFPFANQEGHEKALMYFIKNQQNLNFFHLTANKDESEIAYFNNRDAKWYAGRYVGEARFELDEKRYHISIKPRFGESHFFKMIEEIYNIRISKHRHKINRQYEQSFIIKQLIAFLWLNLLSKANRHGLPRENLKRVYTGSKIKGKLLVRPSIMPLHTEKKVLSQYYEKRFDPTILKILSDAYSILCKEYYLNTLKQSASAKNAIENIVSCQSSCRKVAYGDFNNIKYSPIYLSYKPVVDLSWLIINNKDFANSDGLDKNSFSSFIDMAEIWEAYLRTILKRAFEPKGWHLRKNEYRIYDGKGYQRKIIPDIILEKGQRLIVLDAKYKRMKFDYFDYDREDFFQIHTYINFFQQNESVVLGGLIYPISTSITEETVEKNTSSSLFGKNKSNTNFIVDGIDYSIISSEKISADNQFHLIEAEKHKFLNRLIKLVQ